ncbi:MAG: hypothetical protein QHH09_02645 [Microgenomates group bacterium]|nr:hypothetical protein [Microgenomates group bacterium]
MTYVSPAGQKVQASSDPNKAPIVDISPTNNQQNQVSLTNQPPVTQNNNSSSPQQSYDFTKAEDFRKFIEVEVLKIIKALAEAGKTPKAQIQEIARLTLDLIKPGMTVEQLYQNAVKLDDRHPELAPVVYRVMKEYEQKYEKKALDMVTQLVQEKRFEEAQEVVKKVLAYKAI